MGKVETGLVELLPQHPSLHRQDTSYSKKKNGAPGAIRTPGPQIRSLMLYPAELRVHWSAAIRVGGTVVQGLILRRKLLAG